MAASTEVRPLVVRRVMPCSTLGSEWLGSFEVRTTDWRSVAALLGLTGADLDPVLVSRARNDTARCPVCHRHAA